MAAHRLDPLVRPRSIAVVGASARAGALGNEVLTNLRRGRYSGEIYAVNPGHSSIDGVACYPSLDDLPTVPDQVVFAVADQRLEPLFDRAVALGVPAATIFSALSLAGEAGPALRERIRCKSRDAGMLLHGGNGMGHFNFVDGVWISGFDTCEHQVTGNVVLLSQSGAGMSGILDCERRLQFCFAASTGQELGVAVEDYLEFALELPQTRAVGLFLETSRHPKRFISALARAREREIPVVAIKVGMTDLAAELAVSHSGALAGKDESFQAVFDRYGVQRVADMAELATALIMFAQPVRPAAGGLVTLHDSGGERQLLIDLASQLEVPLTTLSEPARTEIGQLLDPELPPVNPLDAWGSGGSEAPAVMAQCFTALLADPGAALGAVVHDRAPEGAIYPAYLEYLRAARAVSEKPVFLVANHQGTGADPAVIASTAAGLPVLDGLREFLVGARCLLSYRDFLNQDLGDEVVPVDVESGRAERWRKRLAAVDALSELEAGELLREYGVNMVAGVALNCAGDLESLSGGLTFPVVLKTAAPDIAHKTEVGGVVTGIEDLRALALAYERLAQRLGPSALVAPMVTGEGVEMFMGMVSDRQFGPMVIIGIGGVQAELLGDIAVLLPPFSARRAMRALDNLRLRPLLANFRGRAALPVDQFCEMASRLSVLAVELAGCIEEIDINPVALHVNACVGLDALVVASPGPGGPRRPGD